MLLNLICKHCSKEFQTKDVRRVYCSDKCNWGAQNAKRLAKGEKYQTRKCRICEKEYVPLQKRGIGRQTCSDECLKIHRSAWAKERRETTKSWTDKEIRLRLKTKYGLTPEQYQRMMEDQNHSCAICGKKDLAQRSKGKTRQPLVVDHCHTTGKVRGLLCSHCNRGLGFLNDSADLLQKAANYLQSHQDHSS
jgi:endogenous inhibitor of DNA gyrase (YacG/DUF329 family)